MTQLSGDEAQLLTEYAATRSPDAFRGLVDRYVNIVYAAARRQVRDAELARDVTQAVFLVLAEKAGELDPGRPLSGWLLRVARYASANAIRARARRAHHEQRAAQMLSTNSDSRAGGEWETLSPLLDEGMGRLRPRDRDVLLLRFFEQKTAREVAEAMGISEDAAEKRISRAVGKLRDFFQRRGVAISLVALTTTLAAHTAEAAPVGLTMSIASAASATTTTTTTAFAGSIAKGTVITMASAKTKSLLVASLALLLLGGGAVAVTKMVTSSKPHQVVIATPAQPAVATKSLTGATVQFSQGTTVELLGISDAPTDDTRWWSPDGTPITPPTPRPGGGLRGSSSQPSYQLLTRQIDGARGGNAGGVTIMLKGVTVAGSSNTSERGRGGGPWLSSYMFTLWDKTAPPIIDVSLSLAQGQWLDEAQYVLKSAPPSSQPADVSASDITIDSVRDLGKGVTEVGFHFSPAVILERMRGGYEEQIFLVDASGRQYFSQQWRSDGDGRNTLQFKVPFAQAQRLGYRRRPYETREIRNVSLVPGQKTVLAVSDQIKR